MHRQRERLEGRDQEQQKRTRVDWLVKAVYCKP